MFVAVGCGPAIERPVAVSRAPGEAVVLLGRPAMGTLLEVAVYARDRDAAQRLADQAFAIAATWEDVLTTWRPDGELARLNRRAGSGWTPVSKNLEAALVEMVSMSARTGGAFDPAVGALVA